MSKTTQKSSFSFSNIMATIVLSLTFLTVMPSSVIAQGGIDQQTVRFVADVVCGTEFSDNSENLCSRWASSPTLSTFGPGSHHPTVVAKVVRQLNACLPSQVQIKLLQPNDESANIKVYFVPLRDFGQVAKENGFEYIPNNFGFFDVRWNGKFELIRATVLIADDKINGKRLHHYLLEEVTQCCGLAGDSKRFKDSVFYEDAAKREFGNATRFSALDEKLIRFLYRHVQPGSHPIEVGILMAQHWR